MREIQSVACLAEHPNVVKYFRSWQQDSHFYIQMELCEAGNLRTLLDSLSEPLLESQVWRYIEQVAAGLDHIHNHGVLHLDIKPENIFVDGKGSSASTELCDSDFFSDSLKWIRFWVVFKEFYLLELLP
jgi:membrane-associated tyrosine/threonine-specific cdc2-inhibitory kinase